MRLIAILLLCLKNTLHPLKEIYNKYIDSSKVIANKIKDSIIKFRTIKISNKNYNKDKNDAALLIT